MKYEVLHGAVLDRFLSMISSSIFRRCRVSWVRCVKYPAIPSLSCQMFHQKVHYISQMTGPTGAYVLARCMCERMPFYYQFGAGLDTAERNIPCESRLQCRGRHLWQSQSLQREGQCEGDLRFQFGAAAAQKAPELHWLRRTHTGVPFHQDQLQVRCSSVCQSYCP